MQYFSWVAVAFSRPRPGPSGSITNNKRRSPSLPFPKIGDNTAKGGCFRGDLLSGDQRWQPVAGKRMPKADLPANHYPEASIRVPPETFCTSPATFNHRSVWAQPWLTCCNGDRERRHGNRRWALDAFCLRNRSHYLRLHHDRAENGVAGIKKCGAAINTP